MQKISRLRKLFWRLTPKGKAMRKAAAELGISEADFIEAVVHLEDNSVEIVRESIKLHIEAEKKRISDRISSASSQWTPPERPKNSFTSGSRLAGGR